MSSDSLSEGLKAFIIESDELINSSEMTLMALEDESNNQELIGELFRSVHTIKGSAGIFGFNHVVDFTHIVESVMGRARDNITELDDAAISILLDSVDHIKQLVDAAIHDQDITAECNAIGSDLILKLKQYLDEDICSDVNSDNETEIDHQLESIASDSGKAYYNEYWHISIRFDKNVLQNGMDPISFINYLTKIGDIVNIVTIKSQMPKLSEMNPEECYLGFEIDFKSDNDQSEIEDVFEFVRDDCFLGIVPPRSDANRLIQLFEQLPETIEEAISLFLQCHTITAEQANDIMAFDNKDIGKAEDDPLAIENEIGDEIFNDKKIDSSKADNAKKSLSVQKDQIIRIDSSKLSHLIDLVGELVVNNANIESQARSHKDKMMIESVEKISQLVNEIRTVSLGLRMVQIGDTFNRFKRPVRDLCKNLNKKVNLQLIGADTELDKRVVEMIHDPLMHMIRNAIDHGIEAPEQRVALGKPESASLILKAHHESGSIVIEISDDGAGLNSEKIIQKAISKGLVAEANDMSESEINYLIFHPGFSTAETLSSVSGRGVGMDVVKKNIENLRGQVEVASKPGKGCKFTITLPLTLAIIDGFQVNVGGSIYIIPVGMIDECIELNDQIKDKNSQSNFVNLRGEVLPFVRLGDIFDDGREGNVTNKRDNIVVVHCGDQRAGFVVDDLLGEQQAVIKPLGKVFKNLKYFSGATILGGGQIAMILDVPQLLSYVKKAS